MFKQVQEEEVPFHNWHQWVEDQIRKMADFNKRMSQYLEQRSKQKQTFFGKFINKFKRGSKFESQYHKKMEEKSNKQKKPSSRKSSSISDNKDAKQEQKEKGKTDQSQISTKSSPSLEHSSKEEAPTQPLKV
mmetsp:Transcript_1209/g.744  ORF Transcript_1209/g.744 Transcript_1209/m.744 type:complete len:132 (+) Transcript_1209:904-1299(+)